MACSHAARSTDDAKLGCDASTLLHEALEEAPNEADAILY